MENLEAIQKKLVKLLALATSDNEHEAALAMERAQALMKKYNISTVDVAPDGSGARVGRWDIEGQTKKSNSWELRLARALSDAFDAKVLYQSYPTFTICFVGCKSDLEMIKDLYVRVRASVNRMSDHFVDTYRRRNGSAPRIIRNNYRMGLLSTVYSRLQQLKANSNPQQPQYTGGKDLMIVKDKAVEQRFRKEFPNARKGANRRFRAHAGAFSSGQADGHSVSLHKSVGGGSGRPAALSY